jgi:hypothetical protein
MGQQQQNAGSIWEYPIIDNWKSENEYDLNDDSLLGINEIHADWRHTHNIE